MKPLRFIRNILLTGAAVLLAAVVALQILLRPQVLTSLVNRLADDYVEGDVSFRQVRAHVIKSFPFLNVEAEDFSLTYPHERYAVFDTLYPDSGRRFSLRRMGRGETVDTLASFRHLSLSFNYVAFLKGDAYHIRQARLEHPRIFAHYYDSTAANWDMLPLGDKDTSRQKKPFPGLKVDRVSLTDRPLIVFTDPADTLHGLFTMRGLQLDGRDLSVDSLFVSGRLPADTVAFRMDRLRARENKGHVEMDASAAAWLATEHYGRLRVPVELAVDARLPQRDDGAMEVELHRLGLSVASIGVEAKGRVAKSDVWDLDLQAGIDRCPLGEVMAQYRDNIPALRKLDTDATLSLDARVKGVYGGGQMPSVQAAVQVPPATVDYEGMGRKGRVALDLTVATDDLREVNARLGRLLVDFAGAQARLTGSAQDVLGDDPQVSLDGTVHARVDSVTRIFLREAGFAGTGSLDARLHGRVRKSQLDMVHIGAADIQCDLRGQDLWLEGGKDSLSAEIPALELNLSTRANKIDRNIRKGARVLALKASSDTLTARFGGMQVSGSQVLLLLQNSADILKGGKELTPLMGLLKMGRLRLRDGDGMGLSLKDNTETFRIAPATRERPSPRLTLTSDSGRLRLRSGGNFYALRDVKFDISAVRHQSRRMGAERRNHLLDSLQRVYPGVPRDSLFRRARLSRQYREQQDDFASKDIRISLSSAVQQYVRNWDVEGNLDLGSGRLMMPAFPLQTRVSAVQGSFDNDTLDLRNITVQAGVSDVSARAQLTGLRRALTGRGRSHFKLKADVRSNYIDANELMRGYAWYASYVPPEGISEASDEAVEQAVDTAQLPDSVGSKLLVIPSNLEVDFTLEASGIKYDSLQISWAAADVAVRNRTLQVTNALAASNMGDLYFEGFYATRSKQDIKAGFDLNLVDITAEKVITLFPAVDTLMPLLTSFGGDLDCELAATSDIDTCMNLVLPSVDGILKISGKNLRLKESREFSKIARLLMFRDKKKAVIDNMSVTGMVQDNRIDIFPFVIGVDRYLLAASGVQHLDQAFNYHVSVIRSPLLIKFGLNAWGQDFDHIKYGLGRARYKSVNVPVYTKQLDTAQFSLVAAIHNIFELGVEKAMEENRSGLYFQDGTLQLPPAPPAGEQDSYQAALDSLQGMGSSLDDILSRVTTRREALKEEVLRLEEAAAYEQ